MSISYQQPYALGGTDPDPQERGNPPLKLPDMTPEEKDNLRKKWLKSKAQLYDDLVDMSIQAYKEKIIGANKHLKVVKL